MPLNLSKPTGPVVGKTGKFGDYGDGGGLWRQIARRNRRQRKI